MENEKMKNNDDLNLYDIFKENYEKNKEAKAKMELYNKLLNYGKESMTYKNDFAQIESIIGLKNNLEYFFYNFLPYFIQNFLTKELNKIGSDVNRMEIYFDFDLFYPQNDRKYIFANGEKIEYDLPADDDNDFDELLANFIKEYNLCMIISEKDLNQKYYTFIRASLKDLIYACYIGQEWVKSLEDECIDLLSDYYNEEQLVGFKKTLHK